MTTEHWEDGQDVTMAAQEVYALRAARLVEDEYQRATKRWGFDHDIKHTEEEWEALILDYAMRHNWSAVGGLARRALEMRIARPIEDLR